MDISLYYIEKGSGNPLILLHGNGENHGYFEHQIDYFSRSYRVFAIDTRGHGQSPRGNAPFSIRQFADDLYCFMLEHNIGRANILGFSDGGNIAIAFALKHQECIDKLVLNGANLNTDGVKVKIQRQVELDYSRALQNAGFDECSHRKAEILGLMVNDPNFTTADIDTIDIQSLVIVGSDDIIKRSHSLLIHRHLKNSIFKVVAGDHFIASKQWGEFNTEVESFLRLK